MTNIHPPTKGKVIVSGILFWYPLAGVTWQFLHYMIGLRRLGYDPYYVEDSGRWIYDPYLNDISPDATRNIEAVAPILEKYGFSDRWIFRGQYPGGRTYGISEAALQNLLKEADAFLNVTGAQEMREEYLACKRRIYVESDPVRSQILVSQGDEAMIRELEAHDTHFSFGENLGQPDCFVPVERFHWIPTRQPVVQDLWRHTYPDDGGAYSTIATWHSKGKDIVYRGEPYYWSKDREYAKIIDLPQRRPNVSLEIATTVSEEVRGMLNRYGWKIADALQISRDTEEYRRYIQRSRGEFSVAKDQNIRLNSGWFSDRSAVYLAAGRPVIAQETGFSKYLPVGRGLFTYKTMDDILAAIDAIESNYSAQVDAAKEIAAEYFDAERVLGKMMSTAGL